MTGRTRVRLKVNGVSYEKEVEPRRLLSDFLREELDLTGTHVGCEHGVVRRLHGTAQRRQRSFLPVLDRASRWCRGYHR